MQQVQSISPQDIELFVNGLLKGLVQDDDLNAVHACLADAGELESEIGTTITDFKGKHLVKGLTEIGTILSHIQAEVKDCEDMKTDWTRIEKWAVIFKHPVKLVEKVAKTIVTHFRELDGDVHQIEKDDKAGNYAALGEDVAKIAVDAIGAVPASSSSVVETVMLY